MVKRSRPSLLLSFALALFALPGLLAADESAAPVNDEDFFATLAVTEEAPADEAPDVLLETPAPTLLHGNSCTYIGTRDCVPCSVGKRMSCDDYRCLYGGVWHTDSICGVCRTAC